MNIFEIKVKDNKQNETTLEAYKGKVLLIVNTATKCGLTPQYEQLEAIYKKYHEKGFEVLDFPSNQFLKQAPGTDEEITEFCTLNYGTTFPRFAKSDVNGKDTNPLFAYLKEQQPKDTHNEGTGSFIEKIMKLQPFKKEEDIKWNFTKFLVDKQGNVVARYSPTYTPEELTGEIEKLL